MLYIFVGRFERIAISAHSNAFVCAMCLSARAANAMVTDTPM